MIEALIKWVGDNSDFTLGTDLKMFAEETDDDTCVYMVERAGGEVNFYLPDKGAINLRVVSRSLEFHTARDNCWAITRLLNGRSETQMPTVVSGESYLMENAQVFVPPALRGQDEQGRFVYECDLLIRFSDLDS